METLKVEMHLFYEKKFTLGLSLSHRMSRYCHLPNLDCISNIGAFSGNIEYVIQIKFKG